MAPDQLAPDHDAPDQLAPDHDAPDHEAPDHEAPDQLPPDHELRGLMFPALNEILRERHVGEVAGPVDPLRF